MVTKYISPLVKVETFDLIVEGVGVKPNSEFIKSSNITLDDKVISLLMTNFRLIYQIYMRLVIS